MQQPLNCPCPQVYWVNRNATSPWDPPRPVFPCSPLEPAGPGQRRPPPPPPMPPPALPTLLPRPPLPLKKRRDCNSDLWLLMTFFMVLVALAGLGLGMYQLFHLQKELAELRESTSQEHSSSVAKLIGHPAPPSEKKSPRRVAHLTGKPNSRSMPLQWEDTYGIVLISGVKYNKGGLVINDTGMYFVYSKVYFRGQTCNSQPLTHKVYMRTSKYPKDLVLMEGKMMNYCTTGQMWARSSYLGAVFNLTSDDHLYVNVSHISLVNFEESKTFFGLYNL